jgi:hypothetical protein
VGVGVRIDYYHFISIHRTSSVEYRLKRSAVSSIQDALSQWRQAFAILQFIAAAIVHTLPYHIFHASKLF